MATGEILALARRKFDDKRFAEAETLCRQVLREDARQPRALHLLGLLALQAGRHEAALSSFEQALAVDPVDAVSQFQRGVACEALGRADAAATAYREALRLQPDLAAACCRLADGLRARGRFQEAEAVLRQTLAHNPRAATLYNNLGITLAQLGRLDDAVASFERALALQPAFAMAIGNLGLALAKQGKLADAIVSYQKSLCIEPDSAEVLINLGTAFGDQGKLDAAAASYQRAVQVEPGIVEGYVGLGRALVRQGRFTEAADCCRQGLARSPGAIPLLIGLGNALQKQGRFAESIAPLQEAVAREPRSAEAHNLLGAAEAWLGRPAQALFLFERALALAPQLAEAHVNLSMILLQQGDFERGWAECEWRLKQAPFAGQKMDQRRWDGSPLEGRTMLLCSEQGFGDTIQFVRYAALVKERGGRVILQCPDRLTPLLRSMKGLDQVVAQGDAPPFDVREPLLSLPRLFGTRLSSIPAAVPYLFAEPERVEHWRQRLGSVPGAGLKIGIAWQGSINSPTSRIRAFPLACLASIAQMDGVRLFSLQKGPGSEQVEETAGRVPVVDFGAELDVAGGAFLDSAAVMKNLDLVITSDTAIAHLAGALAVPVWVALPIPTDWRWLLEREDTPWYPTMSLFRQPAPGDWPAVFRSMAALLRRRLDSVPRSNVLFHVPVSPGELIDKATILQIKAERFSAADQLANVHAEIAALAPAWTEALAGADEVARLAEQLKCVNQALWDIENGLRACEQRQDFGPAFVALARSVYQRNDERAALKRRINALLGAAFGEQKSYHSGG